MWTGYEASQARLLRKARGWTQGPCRRALQARRAPAGLTGARRPRRAGQELRDDARLLREARLADLSVVQAVPTAQANAFSAPPPEQAAALAAASPATLLAAEVRP
jgi:hypothetical protein